MSLPVIELCPPSDFAALRPVVLDAIHGSRGRYDPEQCRIWAAHLPSTADWSERLSSQKVFVARKNERICGFMTLEPDGLVDLAFIDPDFQGTGLFGRLYELVEQSARAARLERLTVKASLNAAGPFKRVGFTKVSRGKMPLTGATLIRFYMEKRLQDETGKGSK